MAGLGACLAWPGLAVAPSVLCCAVQWGCHAEGPQGRVAHGLAALLLLPFLFGGGGAAATSVCAGSRGACVQRAG